MVVVQLLYQHPAPPDAIGLQLQESFDQRTSVFSQFSWISSASPPCAFRVVGLQTLTWSSRGAILEPTGAVLEATGAILELAGADINIMGPIWSSVQLRQNNSNSNHNNNRIL